MLSWKPGDRVEHTAFGTGTVIEFNDRHAMVHFDDHGLKKFASDRVDLKKSQQPPLAPVARRSRTTSERTTDVGYENLNEQTVVRLTDLEGNLPGQKVYVLKCGRCGTEYGANGCDIHLRRCPACMDGQPGLVF
jgi:hypothetical protein